MRDWEIPWQVSWWVHGVSHSDSGASFSIFDARMDWYLGIVGNFHGVHTSFPQLRNTDGTAMWLGNLLWDFDLRGTL